MTKKNVRKISKKNFPSLKRVTIEEGKRAWEYKGRFYDSLKELDMVTNPTKYMTMNFTPKTEFKPVSDDVTSTNDFIEVVENKEIE